MAQLAARAPGAQGCCTRTGPRAPGGTPGTAAARAAPAAYRTPAAAPAARARPAAPRALACSWRPPRYQRRGLVRTGSGLAMAVTPCSQHTRIRCLRQLDTLGNACAPRPPHCILAAPTAPPGHSGCSHEQPAQQKAWEPTLRSGGEPARALSRGAATPSAPTNSMTSTCDRSCSGRGARMPAARRRARLRISFSAHTCRGRAGWWVRASGSAHPAPCPR